MASNIMVAFKLYWQSAEYRARLSFWLLAELRTWSRCTWCMHTSPHKGPISCTNKTTPVFTRYSALFQVRETRKRHRKAPAILCLDFSVGRVQKGF